MEKIDRNELMKMESTLFNKARDMDVAIYNALVDQHYQDFVLDGLMMYVNSDGGFGSALHIDNYNPNSSVYQTYEALRILDLIGLDQSCKNPLFTTIINKACNYLFNKCNLTDKGWNPSIPSNDQYAHSEEFNYHESFSEQWGFHPTAAIIGYVLQFIDSSKAYYKKANRVLGMAMDYFQSKEKLNRNDIISFDSLLGSLKKVGQFPKECQIIENRLVHEYDSEILLITHCTLSKEQQERLDIELDRLIQRRSSHGLWEHPTDWGSNRYPEADSASLKWIGAESVNVLALLLRFGRIEP